MYGLYRWLIHEPLTTLFYYGPNYNQQIGFWSGQPNTSICASLTNMDNSFWQDHTDDCNLLVQRQLTSYLKTCDVLFYFAVIYWIFQWFQGAYQQAPPVIIMSRFEGSSELVHRGIHLGKSKVYVSP